MGNKRMWLWLLVAALGFAAVPALAVEPVAPVVDAATSGAWPGTYGECAYVLGAYDTPFKRCETVILDGTGVIPTNCTNYSPASGGSQDVLDCEYDALDLDLNGDQDLFYKVYTSCPVPVLMNPDGTNSAQNSLWFNSTPFSYTIAGVPAGKYRVAVYVMDWDSLIPNLRNQDIQVCVGASCSGVDPVGIHRDGVYQLYEVDIAAGATITVHHTKTAGANAVAQGVFFDPISGPLGCANKACSTTLQDTTTHGGWVGTYGSGGYVLLNRPPATDQSPGTTYTAGNFAGGASVTMASSNAKSYLWKTGSNSYQCGYAAAWIWECDDSSGRGLYNPAEAGYEQCGGVAPGCSSGYTTAGAWDDTGERYANGPDLLVDVKVDLPGMWELSFYAVDYDTTSRRETFHLYQYHSNVPLFPPVDIGPFSGGKYVTYTLEGPFEVTLRLEKTAGANAILSGIFVDPADGYDCVGTPPPPDCSTNPGDFCTYTIGGWGAKYAGANPGTIRDDNWSTVYPSGLLRIEGACAGSNKGFIEFTNATAVENYLPCGGPPSDVKNQAFTDPTCEKKGRPVQKNTLMSQVVGLRLNVDYSCAGVLDALYPNPESSICLGDLVIQSGPFAGDTVYGFLEKAEEALLCATFADGLTATDYNWTASAINENFDGCESSDGFLACPTPGGGGGDCGLTVTKSVAMNYPAPKDRNEDGHAPDAYPGEQLTFTLNVAAGSADLTGVTVVDVLPSFTLGDVPYDYYVNVGSCTFNPNSGQSCIYNDATNTLTVNLGAIQARSHVTVSYTVEVNLLAPIATMATNTATVTGSSASGSCSDSDEVSVWIVPGPPVYTTNDIGTPGYWCNHIDQTKNNAFNAAEINGWLLDIEASSRWWTEEGVDLYDSSLPPTFLKVIGTVCGKDNAGSDTSKLERHLLTLWLNVATFHVGTNITLEQICLGGVGYPSGYNKNWTVSQVITFAESELLVPGSTGHDYLFWKDVIDAINNGNAPGFNGCP